MSVWLTVNNLHLPQPVVWSKGSLNLRKKKGRRKRGRKRKKDRSTIVPRSGTGSVQTRLL